MMGGDFRQVLPVVRRGTRAQVVDACLKCSPLWNRVTVLRLTVNMRVMATRTDNQRLWDFCDWQMRIGDGTEEHKGHGEVNILHSFYPRSGDIKAAVFPDENSIRNPSGRVILAPRNDHVRQR